MRQRLITAGRRLRDFLDETLLPRAAKCAICGRERGASVRDCLCDGCREKVFSLRVPPEMCDRCLSPVRAKEACAMCASAAMRDIARVYAPFQYADATAKIITDFKFEACDDMLPFLCEHMAASVGGAAFDCVTPVPLHVSRERKRGVNQAYLLARGLGDRLSLPVETALKRVRATRPQTKLGADRRAENVEGAFACTGDIQGRRVLLVDDVRTMGATAAACAKALKEGGAQSVCLCVAAVVLRPHRKKEKRKWTRLFGRR